MSSKQVRYERVNIDDIDTSSDDDDYGDLFANERSRITKGRPKIQTRKGVKSKSSWCLRGICIITSVLMVLLSLAGLAIYIDPGDNLENFKIKYFDSSNNTDNANVVAVVDSLVDEVDDVDEYQTTTIVETTNKVLTTRNKFLTTTTSTVKSWGDSDNVVGNNSEFKSSSSYIQPSDGEISMM